MWRYSITLPMGLPMHPYGIVSIYSCSNALFFKPWQGWSKCQEFSILLMLSSNLSYGSIGQRKFPRAIFETRRCCHSTFLAPLHFKHFIQLKLALLTQLLENGGEKLSKMLNGVAGTGGQLQLDQRWPPWIQIQAGSFNTLPPSHHQ